MVYPTSGVTVASDIPTYQHSYSDSEVTTQTKYQYIVYLDDGITVVWDSGDITGSTTSTVQPQGYLNNNTYYKIKAFATDGDGIVGYSTLVRFYTNWVISSVTPQFVAIPDDTNARMQLKWSTLASIPGHYTGSGATYEAAIFGNGIRLGDSGEKLYWIKTITDTFTIINRYILKSSKINTLVYIYKNSSNYIRLFYDSAGQRFVCVKCVAGYVRTYGSSTIAIPLDTNLAYAIKQNSTGLFIYTQVSGATEKWGDL